MDGKLLVSQFFPMINENAFTFAFPRRISNVDICHLLHLQLLLYLPLPAGNKRHSLEKMESVVLAKRKNCSQFKPNVILIKFHHNADDR